jgi:coenzyme F420-reducing hydrogenase delta subunit
MKREYKNVRCVVCGEKVEQFFTLVSMNEGVDRVFIVHGGKCEARVEAENIVAIKVERVA